MANVVFVFLNLNLSRKQFQSTGIISYTGTSTGTGSASGQPELEYTTSKPVVNHWQDSAAGTVVTSSAGPLAVSSALAGLQY